MNSVRLLDHFDRISEAPDAVERLRRFILDLAVRGQLVEQIAADEPAVDLLRRIQAEARRLAQGVKARSLPRLEGSDDEIAPFPIPDSWLWCRLSEVGAIVGGGTPPSGDADNFTFPGLGTPWLTPADLGKTRNQFVSRGTRDLTAKGLSESSATVMPAGSVLFTSRAPIGYTAIAANDISTNQGFKSVVPYVSECSLYIATYFRAFAPWINDKATGTTFREVSGKAVANLPFPLPHLAEQRRIVAKVDELMAVCDRLEAAQAERERRRDQLVAASLNGLNEPEADAQVFREHVRFDLDHLSRLVTQQRHVEQLRQTILSLAARGQLVRQEPTDEPATELLNRIKGKKVRALAEGKFKRRMPNPGDATQEPFDLPQHWVWCRVEELATKVTDGEHLTPDREASGRFLLSARNVKDDGIDVRDVDYVGEVEYQRIRKRCDPDKGDVLISCSGSVGRVAIVDKDDAYVMVRSAALVKPVPDSLSSEYLGLVLRSPCLQAQMVERSKITAQANLFIGAIRMLLIPLPPLPEQYRIVAKVRELMTICDQLELSLTTAQTERRRLLEAVLHDALAAPSVDGSKPAIS